MCIMSRTFAEKELESVESGEWPPAAIIGASNAMRFTALDLLGGSDPARATGAPTHKNTLLIAGCFCHT